MKAPFFSVIIPAYNSSEYIDKCIKSVTDQTCGDFEIIIVDDGSKDNTLDICNGYAQKDERIRVIHKENGGHTSARNEGLKNSRGEYIIFLDSDDWLSLDVLDICYSEINNNHPDVVVLNIYNTGIENYFKIRVSPGFYKLEEKENGIVDGLVLDKKGNCVFTKGLIGKIFKRSIIYDNQLNVPKELLIGEDSVAFIGAVLDSSSVSVITDAVYFYYVRKGSVSHSADQEAFHRFPYMFECYRRMFAGRDIVFKNQFYRDIVAQLYTAALLVKRSGAENRELSEGVKFVFENEYISEGFKKSRFSIRGYKFIVKKYILRYRMWWLLRLLDKQGAI